MSIELTVLTEEEQRELYKVFTKEELIDMVIRSDKFIKDATIQLREYNTKLKTL